MAATTRLLLRPGTDSARAEVEKAFSRTRFSAGGTARLVVGPDWLQLHLGDSVVAGKLARVLATRLSEVIVFQEPRAPTQSLQLRVLSAGKVTRELEYSPLAGWTKVRGEPQSWEHGLACLPGSRCARALICRWSTP